MSVFDRKKMRGGALGVDGGEGRGVRLGGRDSRPATGYNNADDLEDDEIVINDSPSLDDYEAIAEGDDVAPGDRRRDPLRH
jgi:hypothetical protein